MRDRHMPRHYLVALASCSSSPSCRCSLRWARSGRHGRRAALVVAVLPARRRLHAARDEVDHPVRAAVGLDLGRRVAGDRVGADDGARRECHRGAQDEITRPWLVAGVLVGLLALNYFDPGRPGGVREPRGGIGLLRGARVQPDPLRRAAVRLGDRAIDVARRATTAPICSARWSAAWASTCRS